ncbi:MAG: 4Fe-4S dicluster domain-containing protein, partial [Gemmatimonadota bacterium]
MRDNPVGLGDLRRLDRTEFPELLEALKAEGYKLVGPTVRDGAIRLQRLEGAGDLPVGWTDEQGPGYYRLRKREDERYFGYVGGPQVWKRHLFPPRDPLIHLKRHGNSLEWQRPLVDDPPMAFIGVLPCDLAAIKILDKVWMGAPFQETRYVARRRRVFIMALNCLEPGELCFCDSMGTGPKAGEGFDLCLTEREGDFLVEIGTPLGERILESLSVSHASTEDRQSLQMALDRARTLMGRRVEAEGLPGILFGNIDHPRWEELANRCLTCGNCTHVCPTCFCFNVRETGTLVDGHEDRERFWDSCFSLDHSMIHGGYFRATQKQRYRQWLTHKFGAWESQFGSSGCVGCGRCIAWCPVGIDVTEEVEAIRRESKGQVAMPVAREYRLNAGDPLIP